MKMLKTSLGYPREAVRNVARFFIWADPEKVQKTQLGKGIPCVHMRFKKGSDETGGLNIPLLRHYRSFKFGEVNKIHASFSLVDNEPDTFTVF